MPTTINRFLDDCQTCGAVRHLLCDWCGAPLWYRQAGERPYDAHGDGHHTCPALPYDYRCAYCGYLRDTPMHELGCRLPTEATVIPKSTPTPRQPQKPGSVAL